MKGPKGRKNGPAATARLHKPLSRGRILEHGALPFADDLLIP